MCVWGGGGGGDHAGKIILCSHKGPNIGLGGGGGGGGVFILDPQSNNYLDWGSHFRPGGPF